MNDHHNSHRGILAAILSGACLLTAQETAATTAELDARLKGWWQTRELPVQYDKFTSFRDGLPKPRFKRWMLTADGLVRDLNEGKTGNAAPDLIATLLADALADRRAGRRTDIYVPWLLAVHRQQSDDLRVQLALAHALCTSDVLGGWDLGKELCETLAARLPDEVFTGHSKQLLAWLPETVAVGDGNAEFLVRFAKTMRSVFDAQQVLGRDSLRDSCLNLLRERLFEQLRAPSGDPFGVIEQMKVVDPGDPYLDLMIVLVAGSNGRRSDGARSAAERFRQAMKEHKVDRADARRSLEALGILAACDDFRISWKHPRELLDLDDKVQECLFATAAGLTQPRKAAENALKSAEHDVDKKRQKVNEQLGKKADAEADVRKHQGIARRSRGNKQRHHINEATEAKKRVNAAKRSIPGVKRRLAKAEAKAAEIQDLYNGIASRLRWLEDR